MKLLFNHNNNGQTEIKEILGFLDGGFTYANLEPDITLNTPYLIDLIGQAVYDKIMGYYEDNGSVTGAEEIERHKSALQYSRLYILSMAYHDFASDNDLSHGNSGRSFRSEENQKIPWEWQLQASNSSIKRRAYKALDQLMLLLDSSGWTEWTTSDQYKKAKSVFIENTNQFDSVFPIQKSGQLYYKLVPFMDDFENDTIAPILTQSVFDALKANNSPSDDEKKLILAIKKAIAYLSLGKAYKAFPVEMFPEGILYNENTRMKSEARAEVMQFLNEEGKNHLVKLEYELSKQNETFEAIDLMQGLDEDSKHVSL